MKDYEYTEKKVKIGSYDYGAIFPKNHSRISGLIWEWKDLNNDGGYSNIPRWTRTMYIREKGSKKWNLIPNNDQNYKWAVVGMGYLQVLYGLEKPEVLERLEIEDDIVNLEKLIAVSKKDLGNAKKELAQLKKKGKR